jgi:hypothetical protein
MVVIHHQKLKASCLCSCNLLKSSLAVFINLLEVAQLVPSYSSVAEKVVTNWGRISPPKAKAAVCIPAAARYLLSCCI